MPKRGVFQDTEEATGALVGKSFKGDDGGDSPYVACRR
jgi:hypothetical protein